MELQALTKRGYLCLETKDFEKAATFFENALNENAEDSYAYIGKLLIDFNLSSIEGLKELMVPVDSNRNFELAYRFADDELKNELDSYVKQISENINNQDAKKQEAIYSIAVKHKEAATTKQEYSDAIKDLLRAGTDYKDVKEQVAECREKMMECDYNAVMDSIRKAYAMPASEEKIEKLNTIITVIKPLGDYKEINTKIPVIEEKIQSVKNELEQAHIAKELQEKEEQEKKELAEKKSNQKKAIIAVVAIFAVIIIGVAGFFIFKSSVNKTMDGYISGNQTNKAYSYYKDNASYLKEGTLDEILKLCVTTGDFKTLIKIEYDTSNNNDSSQVAKVVEANITKEQYDKYYNQVLSYYDVGNNFDFEGGIYKQYHLLYFLPDKYKNIKEIKGVYKVLVGYGYDESSYSEFMRDWDEAFPDSFEDDMIKYCKYSQINNYLVADESFMSGKWSDSDGNYVTFSHDNEGGHCSYNIPTPSNDYHYDYYQIVDGKYNLYVKDDRDDNVDCFKFTLKGKNKMEVYDYTNKRTYIMTR